MWSMLFPQRSFTLSMIQEWDDVNLEKLKLFFAPKEQLFIESCLKLTDRSSCTDLLSQDLLTNKEIIRSWNPVNVNPKIVNDLASLITEICQSEDKLTEDMRVQLSGLCLSLQSSQSNP